MKFTFFYSLVFLTSSFLFGSQSWAMEFLGQKQSVTEWGSLPIESFLSFSKWKEESDVRDTVSDWDKILRERNHREIVGRIYQCVGTCRIDHGQSFFNGSYRTGLYEGDEIQTMGDSYAWIFLFDGTMVRLSPSSSVTFNEFNVGVKENFISARINAGNVLWLSRQEKLFEPHNIRETDVVFFPYSEYESLPISQTKPYIEDDLMEMLTEKTSDFNHYKTLNEEITKNNKLTHKKPTYAYLVMPNATVMGFTPSVEIVSLIGGKSYIKKRSHQDLGLVLEEGETAISDQEVFLQLRGYENKELTTLSHESWFAIDEKGKAFEPEKEMPWLSVGEFITKRIPSIMLGREIFLARYSEFSFREKYDPIALATKDGYRLWGKLTSAEGEKKEDLELRLDFLKEYFRRVETTNLVASANFRARMESRGEDVKAMEYGDYFFKTALNRYYSFGEKANPRNFNDKETGEVLNSTKKLLWKKMHGIR